MKAILEELAQLKGEFDSLPDGFSRYTYLVELSALLPKEDGLNTGERLYRGCQSQVWLWARRENGLCRLSADSDTLIIRGVLALFVGLLDGKPVDEVLEARFDLLEALGIGEHFSSQRTSGIAGLLPEIQRRLRDAL